MGKAQRAHHKKASGAHLPRKGTATSRFGRGAQRKAMHSDDDRLTADQIIETLAAEGYGLSKRTFQFYVQAGLLPKGIRIGSRSGGVRFYYSRSVLRRLRLVCTLKEQGFKLAEIKEHLDGADLGPLGAVPARTPVLAIGSIPTGESGGALPGAERKTGELYERIMRLTPGGSSLRRCLQCGTCGGSCPSANDMDYTPRQLFALLQSGHEEEVLTSNTAWFCVSCYHCTVRCPQQIPITELMYTVKELAIRAGHVQINDSFDFARSFVNLLEKFGRSFDIGLASRYHLVHEGMSKVAPATLAVQPYRKERIIAGPSKVEHLDQWRRIIAKANSMEDDWGAE